VQHVTSHYYQQLCFNEGCCGFKSSERPLKVTAGIGYSPGTKIPVVRKIAIAANEHLIYLRLEYFTDMRDVGFPQKSYQTFILMFDAPTSAAR